MKCDLAIKTDNIEYGITNNDNVFLNYKTAPSVTMIDLGDVDNLFTSKSNIPLASIIQNSLNNFTIINNNNAKPESNHSLLIAIEF